MKTRFETRSPGLPGIGERWKHEGQDEEFIRIDDGAGAKACGLESWDTLFFSVRTSDWTVVFQEKARDNIVVLGRDKTAWLPAVGEAWRHKDGDFIYVRVADEQGSKTTGASANGSFFSVRLSDGAFLSTDTTVTSAVSLKAASVDSDGTVVFTEA